MKSQSLWGILCILGLFSSCQKALPTDRSAYYVGVPVKSTPDLDGKANEACWEVAEWYPIDQVWQGEPTSKEDFNGRFKVAWSKDFIYLFIEITDDSLSDKRLNSLDTFWEDDGLNIYIDEDHSGGEHELSHNAFAYHLALDGNVVDKSPDNSFLFYNHVTTVRICEGNTCTWEIAISVFNDTFDDFSTNDQIQLEKGKRLGFAISYYDNDGAKLRDNVFGSVPIPGEDPDIADKNADVFGTLELKYE